MTGVQTCALPISNIVSIVVATPLSNAGSTLSVLDPNGNEVDDRSVTINGVNITVGMQNLTISGNYTVNYALFSDTDQPLTGSFTFTFNSPGAVTNSTNNSDTKSSSNPSPSKIQNKPAQNQGVQSATAGNTFVYVLIGLAFAVAILLLWYTYFLIKKRS